MKLSKHCVQAFLVVACAFKLDAASAQSVVPIGSGYFEPAGVAVDGGGNVFVADQGTVKEVLAAGGYQTVNEIGNGFNEATAVAIDSAGHFFVADTQDNAVLEIFTVGGSTTAKKLGSGFNRPGGVALDGSGNVFVTDTINNAVKEILSVGGYVTVITIGSGFSQPTGIALDRQGNVFVADTGNSVVKEIAKAGGYTTISTLAVSFSAPVGVAIDSSGNAFITDDDQSGVVIEIVAVGGYSTARSIASKYDAVSIAVDRNDNLFIATPYDSVSEILAAGGYATAVPLNGPFFTPAGIAVDGSGNVFITDRSTNSLLEMFATNNYSTSQFVAAGFAGAESVALDPAGNVFVLNANTGSIEEVVRAGGYTAMKLLYMYDPGEPGGTFVGAQGIAVDSSDNVFIADTENNAVRELVAAQNYSTVKTLPGGFQSPGGLMIDGSGNVFVGDSGNGVVKEVLAASGYNSVNTLPIALQYPRGLAQDSGGNIFVDDAASVKEILAAGGYTTAYTILLDRTNFGISVGNVVVDSFALDSGDHVFFSDPGVPEAVYEFLPPAPSPIAAAVLPGARAVHVGTAATIFATMINTGPSALQNCAIALPALDSGTNLLSLNYQTTNPVTNALTGSPNVPVSLAGNDGVQTFLVAIQSQISGFSNDYDLDFSCNGAPPAQSFLGIDTVNLTFSDTASADIIALAATTTNNGIVDVPQGGAAAFSIASMNIGANQLVAVAVDTGTTILPLTAAICQTDPNTAQCLAAPSAKFSMTYAANTSATFSVFLQSNGPIAFQPALSRVFVRFRDPSPASIGMFGATSVAVRSP